VLIQQGKGADMGASFGAGSSATVFGSGGSGNFLTNIVSLYNYINRSLESL
jgi:preprotein translocase subunit SecG